MLFTLSDTNVVAFKFERIILKFDYENIFLLNNKIP